MKPKCDRRRLGSGLFAGTLVISALGAALVAGPAAQAASNVTLSETGSTLLYPLFQLWIPDYAHIAPNVTVTTAATGSGAGIDGAISGAVRIGASDAYMSDQQVEKNRGILNIPVAIAAQTVNYNVSGLNDANLKLDGPTLAGIYSGRITTWDAPAIAAMNPGVKLLHETIVPIRRAEASGDTFVFTQFLDFSTQTWEYKVGYGITVAWPAVAGEKTATGNDGIVQALAATPYSVGYIGISFREAITKAGLGTVMLRIRAGNSCCRPPRPSARARPSSIGARRRTSGLRSPLRPATNPTRWSTMSTSWSRPTRTIPPPQMPFATSCSGRSPWKAATRAKYLDAVSFIALPNFIRALSEKQIELIKAPGQSQ